MNNNGIVIERIVPGFAASQAGLKSGDIVLFINGHSLSDEFDFRYHAATDVARLLIDRNGMRKEITLFRESNTLLGIEFKEKPVRKCANRCVFCFIDQMPKGLRSSLYVKDEDLGHSFTNGNYVTLSATPYSELERISAIGLSPIFISVHATNHDVRLRLLGVKKAYPIMEQMRFLEKAHVQFHTQIVVCPGFNDGDVLKKSIRDLLSFKKGLQSIAIVPVGLTKHRKLVLEPVSEKMAKEICLYVQKESDKDLAQHGLRRLFLADEFFIKANMPIPAKKYYEDYPQIENGVGLVRQLLDEWRVLKNDMKKDSDTNAKRPAKKQKQTLVITSHSAFFYVNKIIMEMSGLLTRGTCSVVAADNHFFGESVTVAGLLTAGDVLKAIRNGKKHYDRIFVPAVMFNYKGNTLDGFSAKRLEKEAGTKMTVTNSLKDIAKII